MKKKHEKLKSKEAVKLELMKIENVIEEWTHYMEIYKALYRECNKPHKFTYNYSMLLTIFYFMFEV
ncbi:hypothetical protein HanPI659440_Chr04g0182771 [Helianthus annuus]|nr:hypothetical protein HanPI659440_Chr04g0182771 [Helianthus annuus]